MPSKRGGIVAASVMGMIFVFGGEAVSGTFPNNEQYFSTNNTWRVRQQMPTSRHGLSAAVVGNQIFVIGGGRNPGLTVSSLNESFIPTVLVPEFPPAILPIFVAMLIALVFVIRRQVVQKAK